MESAKAAIEVVAGLIPGKDPLPELTRRWFITSSEWDAARQQNEAEVEKTGPLRDQLMPVDYLGRLMADKQGQAMSYAQLLMFQPDQLNWVRVDWIWF